MQFDLGVTTDWTTMRPSLAIFKEQGDQSPLLVNHLDGWH
jgi:hypothetical protein